jgi:5,10-methylenetetrahydromethanopterin reductase
MTQIWNLGVASPRGVMKVAKHLETAGWQGLVVVDSQNLSGDAYVALAMAATVTERLGLGTGVTNSLTRQAAVTASAIASVQRVSNGRAVLGIGRGDSALAHLGRAPASVSQFDAYVRQLKTYLDGNAVAFDEIDIADHQAKPVAALELADSPSDSRIPWLAKVPHVPIEVAATGPRVIEIAALYGDRVMFTLGADSDRLAWGIDIAREARKRAGLDPHGIVFGAYLNVGCHRDINVARSLVRGGLTTFARFSVMHGNVAGPVSESQRQVLNALHDSYDMRAHTRVNSRQAGTLTDEFIDRFAVVGSPDQVTRRLADLSKLGLDKFILSGMGPGGAEHVSQALALFEAEVLPNL